MPAPKGEKQVVKIRKNKLLSQFLIPVHQNAKIDTGT